MDKCTLKLVARWNWWISNFGCEGQFSFQTEKKFGKLKNSFLFTNSKKQLTLKCDFLVNFSKSGTKITPKIHIQKSIYKFSIMIIKKQVFEIILNAKLHLEIIFMVKSKDFKILDVNFGGNFYSKLRKSHQYPRREKRRMPIYIFNQVCQAEKFLLSFRRRILLLVGNSL